MITAMLQPSHGEDSTLQRGARRLEAHRPARNRIHAAPEDSGSNVSHYYLDASNTVARCLAMARPRGMGTALPICRAMDIFEPTH